MFLCSLRYCLKFHFSKGVYSFTLSTVYIYIYIYIYKLLKFFHVIFYSFYLTITGLINTTQLKIPELNVK